MEDYQREVSNIKSRDKKDLLLTNKDPHLSHLYEHDPKTPNSATDGLSNSVLDDENAFHENESKEPEYRLFEEQGGSYVPDLSPAQSLLIPRDSDVTISHSPAASRSYGYSKTKDLKFAPDYQAKNLKVPDSRDKLKSPKVYYYASTAVENNLSKSIENFQGDQNNNIGDANKINLQHKSDNVKSSAITTSVIISTKQTPSLNPVSNQPSMTSANQSYSVAHNPGNLAPHNNGFNSDNSQYNINLLAHSAQLVLQNTDSSPVATENTAIGINATASTSDNMHYQESSDFLRQLAMRAQLRDQQDSSNNDQQQQQSLSNRQQHLRQSFSSSVQLQKALSCDSKMKESMQYQSQHCRQRPPLHESKSEAAISSIDDAPLLKDLLTHNTRVTASAASLNQVQQQEPSRPVSFQLGGLNEITNQKQESQLQQQQSFIGQENMNSIGTANNNLSSPCHPKMPLPQNSFYSDNTITTLYQYQNNTMYSSHLNQGANVANTELPHSFNHHNSTTPLQSPSFGQSSVEQQQPYPQSDPNQTPTTPHHPMQSNTFFPNVINNNIPQQHQQGDSTNTAFNDLIAAGEKLAASEQISTNDQIVQDFIEATGSSDDHNGHNNNMYLPNLGDNNTIQSTNQPPVYPFVSNQDRGNPMGQQNNPMGMMEGVNMMNYRTDIKQEPQSPMLKSPHHTNFLGSRFPTSFHGQPLQSPSGIGGAVNRTLSNSSLPPTPTSDQHWQYPQPQSQAQYHSASPASSGILSPNQVPVLHQQQKMSRTRRSSGGSGRKNLNADGTLSCTICGHSFRSMPALNGHMRVHSSSTEKKTKDDHRPRKLSSSGSRDVLISPSSTQAASLPSKTATLSILPYQHTSQYSGYTAYPNSNVFPTCTIPSQEYISAAKIGNENSANIKTDSVPVQGFPTQMQPQEALLAAASLAGANLFPKTEIGEYNNYYTSASAIARPILIGSPYHQPQMLLAPPATSGVRFSPYLKMDHHEIPHYIAPTVLSQESVAASNIMMINNPQPTSSILVSALPPAHLDHIVDMQQNYAQQQHQQSIPGGYQAVNPIYLDPNHRSTPLADFADIAVAHNEGLFNSGTPNKGFQTQSNSDNQTESQKSSQPENNIEQEPDVSSDIALMESVDKDLLWQPSTSEEVINTNDIAKLVKNDEREETGDPFILPASVPHLENSTFNTMQMNASDSFINDPLMQEALNAANPSKILPNSMMGGNPGSNFKSFRQRHHSEGSMLKTILHTNMPNIESLIDMPQHQMQNFPKPFESHATIHEEKIKATTKRPAEKPLGGAKHAKVPKPASHEDIVPLVPPSSLQNSNTGKKEVWTVPKSIPARQRHRRHSADSRIPNRNFLRPYSLTSTGIMVKGGQRPKRRPPPLVIPASVNALTPNNALYQSQLHRIRRVSGESGNSNSGVDKIPPYTPPPMLSPMRSGPGLYHSTPQTPMKLLQRQMSHEPIPPTIEEEDETDRCPEPKINVGSEFQATLPKIRSRKYAEKDVHKAKLVWKPPGDKTKYAKQVEDFVTLACSAVVPFGGCNKEYALHLLHQYNGDIVSCLKSLVEVNPKVNCRHWMASYTYTGTSKWSPAQRSAFDKHMLTNRKDFFVISKLIGSKSVAECVDYYYHTLKRRKRRIQRPRRYRQDSEEESSDKSTGATDEEYIPYVPPRYSHNNYEIEESTHITLRNSENNPVPHVYNQNPSVPNHHATIQIPSPSQLRNNPQQHIKVQYHQAHTVTASKPALSFPCKYNNCQQSFATAHLLFQHQSVHKNPSKPYLERIQASPSPANSPASSENTEQPQQMFACPRCGKSFAKVKSRNAHMKTHGKLAEEKRKQKEEEALKKEMEAAQKKQERMMMNMNWEAQQRFNVPVPQSYFRPPATTKT